MAKFKSIAEYPDDQKDLRNKKQLFEVIGTHHHKTGSIIVKTSLTGYQKDHER